MKEQQNSLLFSPVSKLQILSWHNYGMQKSHSSPIHTVKKTARNQCKYIDCDIYTSGINFDHKQTKEDTFIGAHIKIARHKFTMFYASVNIH